MTSTPPSAATLQLLRSHSMDATADGVQPPAVNVLSVSTEASTRSHHLRRHSHRTSVSPSSSTSSSSSSSSKSGGGGHHHSHSHSHSHSGDGTRSVSPAPLSPPTSATSPDPRVVRQLSPATLTLSPTPQPLDPVTVEKFNKVYISLSVGDSSAKLAVLKFMGSLTDEAKSLRTVVISKGLQPVIAVCCSFDEPGMQLLALSVLIQMISDPQVCDREASDSSLLSALNSVIEFSSESMVLEKVLVLIYSLSKVCSLKSGDTGGSSTLEWDNLVSALTRTLPASYLPSKGKAVLCGCLNNIMHPMRHQRHRQFCQEKGVNAILNAIQGDAPPLTVNAGLSVLLQLCQVEEDNVRKLLCKIVVASGVLPVLSDLMSLFKTNSSIIGNTLCILSNLVVSGAKVEHSVLAGRITDLIVSGTLPPAQEFDALVVLEYITSNERSFETLTGIGEVLLKMSPSLENPRDSEFMRKWLSTILNISVSDILRFEVVFFVGPKQLNQVFRDLQHLFDPGLTELFNNCQKKLKAPMSKANLASLMGSSRMSLMLDASDEIGFEFEEDDEQQADYPPEATTSTSESGALCREGSIRATPRQVGFVIPPKPGTPPKPSTEQRPERPTAKATTLRADGMTLRMFSRSTARDAVMKNAEVNKRKCITNEILSTEKSYLASLSTCITHYFQPMASGEHGVSKEQATSLFGTMSQINTEASQFFIALTKAIEMEAQHQPNPAPANPGTPPSPSLGSVFLTWWATGSLLGKYYEEYITTYDDKLELVDKLQKEVHFRTWVKEVGLSEATNRTSLNSFMIMPVQRIPRYILLLQSLLEVTPPSHPDHDNLKKAAEIVKETALTINHHKQVVENTKKLASLSTKVTEVPHDFVFSTPGRSYIYDGALTHLKMKKAKSAKAPSPPSGPVPSAALVGQAIGSSFANPTPEQTVTGSVHCYFFLLSDTLLWTVQTKSHFKLCKILPLNSVKVFEIGEQEIRDSGGQLNATMFLLMWSKENDIQERRFIMATSSPIEKKTWVNSIKDASNAHKRALQLQRQAALLVTSSAAQLQPSQPALATSTASPATQPPTPTPAPAASVTATAAPASIPVKQIPAKKD